MKWRWPLGVIVVTLLLSWWGGCLSRRPTLEERLQGRAMPELSTVGWRGRAVNYASTGPRDAPLIVMVHGTPGSWQAYLDYLVDPRLADDCRVIAIDRPGWGGSGAGRLEVTLEAQASAVVAVIEAQKTEQPVFILGHSLGGTIVARVAMDRPDLIDGVLIVSASLDPAVERPTWYQSMARWRVVQWAVPEGLDWANRELEPLPAELNEMTPLWSKFEATVTVLHGEKDGLVPVAHANYSQKMAKNAAVRTVVWPDEGHFALWSNRGAVVDELLATMDRSSPGDSATKLF